MSENKTISVRAQILNEARHIVTGERESQYGKPEDVAIMMALLKVARIATGAGKVDNYVDLAGYAACAGEIRMKNQRQPEEKAAESDEKAAEDDEKPARSSGAEDDDWWV